MLKTRQRRSGRGGLLLAATTLAGLIGLAALGALLLPASPGGWALAIFIVVGLALLTPAALFAADISERKRAEQRALEYQRIREFHFDNTPLAVVEWTPDLRVKRWSKQAERMFGWTEAELIGRSPFEWGFAHQDDRTATEQVATVIVDGSERSVPQLLRNYRKDGSYGWYQWHNAMLRDADGKLLSVHSMGHDVSELRFALQTLHESESQLRGVFEQAAVGIAMLDENGRWLSVNHRLCDMLGYSREELLQLDYRRLTHPDDVAANVALSERVYRGEIANFTLDKRYIHRDGHAIWVTLYIRRIDATGSMPLRCAGIIVDISERKRAEALSFESLSAREAAIDALHESETRFRSVFEQAAVGIAMLDENGRWLSVNHRLCDIVGYRLDELLKLDFQVITHPDDLAADVDLANRVVAGALDHYSMEKRYIRKDGNIVWIMLHVRRIDATATTAMRFVSVVEDITERKQAEADVLKLNAELERKVSERTRQLQQTMRDWAERNHELSLLAEMMGVLPAARDIAEASQIVARYLPRLFHHCSGAVWLEDGTPERYALLGHWGGGDTPMHSLSTEDCWALRRGQMLRVDDPGDPLCCPHLGLHTGAHPRRQEPHACLPIIAVGETVGLIHVQWSERSDATGMPPEKVVLSSAAEQIGLAIGNVRLREELRRQALRDPLTGLYNRRHFDEYLSGRIAEQSRSGRGFVLLMIDLDHFKAVNDSYGHDGGDEVLRSTSRLLQRTVRAGEAVFRLGGEEFALVINDGPGNDAAGCAERLRREIQQQRLNHNGQSLPGQTISIGVARCPSDGSDSLALMKRADQALYAAKRTGRNRVCFASATPDQPLALIAMVEPAAEASESPVGLKPRKPRG